MKKISHMIHINVNMHKLFFKEGFVLYIAVSEITFGNSRKQLIFFFFKENHLTVIEIVG